MNCIFVCKKTLHRKFPCDAFFFISSASKPSQIDNNLKFDENGRKSSKRVENTVGKGEIARYEQFLLFPQCFQKACFPGASICVNVWEWVNLLPTPVRLT